jgi:hypothetical protein
MLNADTQGNPIVLDSLFYLDYACKLNVKNQSNGLYIATATKSDNESRTKEVKTIVFSVKGSDYKLVVSEDELKRLKPLYMP